MPDDPYVPVGGWEAAGYGGFTPNYALQTINPYATPAYTPTMSAPQQLLGYSSGIQAGPAVQTTNYTPQSLIASPTQQGYGMTGPVMTNQFSTSRGGAGGGTPAIAQPGTVQNTNTAGGYSGLLGGSSAPAVADGSGYWDNDQWVTFNSQPSNPYGDLSGSQPANPYGDLSGSQPSNPYGNLSGIPAMTPPSPYGNLSGSQPGSVSTGYQAPSTGVQMPSGGSPYGNLSGVPANPYGSLSNSAATGGASLSTPVSGSGYFNDNGQWTSFNQPSQGVQMPGSSPYGGLLGSSMPSPSTTPNPANLPSPNANPVSSGPQAQVPGDNYGFPADDQTYMDMPQGPNGQYGSLMGGQDYGEENPWAQSIGSSGNPNPGTVQINTPPAMPINTQPQNPGPTGVQMPGGSPYGALPTTMGNTKPTYDEWVRKASTPIYSSMDAAQAAYNRQYGDLSGSQPTPQQDAYLFPTQSLMSPTDVYGDGGYTMQQPAPRPAQQQFQQGMQPQAPSQYQPSFGSIPQFTPMPAAADALKSTDRVPQTGGFTGYSPPALPPASQPTPYQPSMFEGLLGGGGGDELGFGQRRFGS